MRSRRFHQCAIHTCPRQLCIMAHGPNLAAKLFNTYAKKWTFKSFKFRSHTLFRWILKYNETLACIAPISRLSLANSVSVLKYQNLLDLTHVHTGKRTCFWKRNSFSYKALSCLCVRHVGRKLFLKDVETYTLNLTLMLLKWGNISQYKWF